jgi:hypothetical protein
VKPPPIKVQAKRRGAPPGHPGWHRRPPDHIDQTIQVPAPIVCPHCQCEKLAPWDETYEHDQEDIILVPRTRVVRFVHKQCFCPKCRHPVYQTGEGELRGCEIGPVTRAVAMHLRYNLQIPYRHVQHILADLFGMPLVPATAMNFDRQATELGRPFFEQLRQMLQNSPVVYSDDTSWREDGQGHYIWFGGNKDVAVYLLTDNRASQSAVKLLGEEFDGTLVSDDYAGYNATNPKDRQTCWQHLRTKSKEILQQIELTRPPIAVPRAVEFCGKLDKFGLRMCALGRLKERGKLSLRKAKAMIPKLQKQLKRFATKPLDHPEAETLRTRVMEKDWDKLFTFLRVKDVEPTNNLSERSLRFLVILRKISFGTRSPEGSESHGVLASLLQTARLQGKKAVDFLVTLLTRSTAEVKAALFGGTS